MGYLCHLGAWIQRYCGEKVVWVERVTGFIKFSRASINVWRWSKIWPEFLRGSEWVCTDLNHLYEFYRLEREFRIPESLSDKFAVARLETLLRRDLDTGVFLWILLNFSDHLFHRIPLVDFFWASKYYLENCFFHHIMSVILINIFDKSYSKLTSPDHIRSKLKTFLNFSSWLSLSLQYPKGFFLIPEDITDVFMCFFLGKDNFRKIWILTKVRGKLFKFVLALTDLCQILDQRQILDPAQTFDLQQKFIDPRKNFIVPDDPLDACRLWLRLPIQSTQFSRFVVATAVNSIMDYFAFRISWHKFKTDFLWYFKTTLSKTIHFIRRS